MTRSWELIAWPPAAADGAGAQPDAKPPAHSHLPRRWAGTNPGAWESTASPRPVRPSKLKALTCHRRIIAAGKFCVRCASWFWQLRGCLQPSQVKVAALSCALLVLRALGPGLFCEASDEAGGRQSRQPEGRCSCKHPTGIHGVGQLWEWTRGWAQSCVL